MGQLGVSMQLCTARRSLGHVSLGVPKHTCKQKPARSSTNSRIPALEFPCIRPKWVSGHKAEAFSLEGGPRMKHDSVAGTTRILWQH